MDVAAGHQVVKKARSPSAPLFWLQYAIGMAEGGKLAAAREFIETAYDQAAKREGFQTYQIDTQAFRIALQFETEATPGSAVSTLPMLLENAIKVLENINPFIVRRVADLTIPEKTSLTFWMNTLIDTLGQLSADYRARSGSDQTRAVLENAKRLLLK